METAVKAARPSAQHRRGIPGFDAATVVPFVVFTIAVALIPRFAQEKQITALIYIGINVLLAVGLNLLMGYAGQISLGHAAFFGIGAYISAIMTVKPIPAEVIPGFSTGIGVMAAIAVFISLTRSAGGRLVTAVAALLLLTWLGKLAGGAWFLMIPVLVVGMALFGLASRSGWLKGAVAGGAGAVASIWTSGFLAGVLAGGGSSPWMGMLVGVFLTALIAYLIGGQVLRLKGHYLAMATLGFGIIVEIVFRQWVAVTGGSSDGIYGIPSIDSVPGLLTRVYELSAGGSINPKVQYYYVVWTFVLIALILAVNIVRSRVGRAFRAVHGSEVAAESLGVDTERYKVQVFVLSAALASVAGSLHAHNSGIGYINPSEFSFVVSVQLMVMVVVGGMASVWGALFGAGTIELIKGWLLEIEKSHTQLMGLTLRGLDPIVFGAVLIGVMILLPQGLVRGLADGLSAMIRAARKSRGAAS